MSAFADTSFLVSIYTLDDHSRRATATLRRIVLPIRVSTLGEVELHNALSLRVFRGELTLAEAEAARKLFEDDIETGVLNVHSIPAEAFARAQIVARGKTPGLGLRTLDIIQVACALQAGVSIFLTFDERQKRLAQSEGLLTP